MLLLLLLLLVGVCVCVVFLFLFWGGVRGGVGGIKQQEPGSTLLLCKLQHCKPKVLIL